MNTHALLFGIAAGLLLAGGTADAGTCSAEIESLQKTLGSIGTMASADTASGASISQGTEATVAANTGSSSAPAPVPDPNGTDASGGVMANASPAQTAPLDSDAAQSGAPGNSATANPDAASKSLARARAFDQAGDEAACMNAVNQAKSQLGQQ
jgi:hypothetical protein